MQIFNTQNITFKIIQNKVDSVCSILQNSRKTENKYVEQKCMIDPYERESFPSPRSVPSKNTYLLNVLTSSFLRLVDKPSI